MSKPFIYFITGASGVGKTVLVSLLEKKYKDKKDWLFLHFDAIGVPSVDVMKKRFGSMENWQEETTYQWVEKMLTEHKGKRIIIIEGQVNIEFIKKGFSKRQYNNYQIIYVYCDEKEMYRRLVSDRDQADLANEDMRNWLKFLNEQAKELKVRSIDTTNLSKKEFLEEFERIIDN